MIRPARLSPIAIEDLREAATWIARDNPNAARALRTAVRQAAMQIGEYPRSAPVRPELVPAPVRVMAVPGWPYLIIYDEAGGRPVILRLIHAARDVPETLAVDFPG